MLKCNMRTTIDLPDNLFREVKARAALSGLKLKELIAQFVEMGLEQSPTGPYGSVEDRMVGQAFKRPDTPAGGPRHSPPPLIAKAMTGKPIPALSNRELAEIELEEDVEKLRRSYGR